jgi:hypothetical protein
MGSAWFLLCNITIFIFTPSQRDGMARAMRRRVKRRQIGIFHRTPAFCLADNGQALTSPAKVIPGRMPVALEVSAATPICRNDEETPPDRGS